MKLDPIKLYNLLDEKGISHLHHANTVTTSLTFLKAGGLLSRGAVERKKLFQTAQAKSDSKDKFFDVWRDIFLDADDLHSHFGRENAYGPVLFRFSKELLLKVKWEIWVTKDNPMRWKTNMKDRDKYFPSVNTLRDMWDSYLPERRMITLRNVGRPALFKYLDDIVIDNPEIQIGDLDLHAEAFHALRLAVINAGLRVKVKTRTAHRRSCFCLDNYGSMKTSDQIKHFLPLEKFRQK